METTTTHLTWQAVCEDPNLQDLPFKIELDRQGRLIMSPTRLQHGEYQSEIAYWLRQHTRGTGKIITECAVETEAGIKVADVGWFSQARWAIVKESYASPMAPELCIEILSPGNTEAEMAKKRTLYFAAGADEVWICDIAGTMHFFNADGKLSRSDRVPDFPTKLDV